MQDPSVVQNYGSLLEQLVQTIPDGLVPAQAAICKVKLGLILCKTDLFEYMTTFDHTYVYTMCV